MSKSSGDFLRLHSLVEQGIDPLAYRYLCLGAHYRSSLNFTDEALRAAASGLARLRVAVHGLGDAQGEADSVWLARFAAQVNDDLNYPRALAVAWELLKSGLPDAVKKATMVRFDAALGLDLLAWRPAQVAVPQPVQAWMAERAIARAQRQWAEADRLRALARAAGYDIDDTPQGQQARPL